MGKGVQVSRSHVIFYTKENGREVLSYPEWAWGTYHREDGPAIEYRNISRRWYRDGKRLYKLDRAYLTRYMELKGLTIAHLLLDPDPMVRTSAEEIIDWTE